MVISGVLPLASLAGPVEEIVSRAPGSCVSTCRPLAGKRAVEGVHHKVGHGVSAEGAPRQQAASGRALVGQLEWASMLRRRRCNVPALCNAALQNAQ